MTAILQSLLTLVLVYKYLAIFIISFLGSMGLPFPTAAILVAAGLFSGQGYLSFPLTLISAFLGTIFGDNSAYWIARLDGEKILSKIGLSRLLKSEHMRKAGSVISDHSFPIFFFSRFLSTIGSVLNIAGGLEKTNYLRFFIPVMLGEIIYTIGGGTIGYIWGNNLPYVNGVLSQVGSAAVIASAILILLWYGINRRKKNDSRNAPRARE